MCRRKLAWITLHQFYHNLGCWVYIKIEKSGNNMDIFGEIVSILVLKHSVLLFLTDSCLVVLMYDDHFWIIYVVSYADDTVDTRSDVVQTLRGYQTLMSSVWISGVGGYGCSILYPYCTIVCIPMYFFTRFGRHWRWRIRCWTGW